MTFGKRRIYLDYAAATPMRKEVRRVMNRYSNLFANPSALYEEGVNTRAILEESRTRIARLLHAGAKDIIFTSGGTESDNLAILGTFEKSKETIPRPHIIVLEHEHPAILEAAREAERRGAELSLVPASEVVHTMKENTVLVSLSYCNSETGAIAPVSTIGRAVRDLRKKQGSEYPYFHVDMSQAILTQDSNVDTLRADLLTLDAGKMYGPKGVGALVVRPWTHLRPLLMGGGQERGLRSGTENLEGIVGLAEALSCIDKERILAVERYSELKAYFLELIEKEIPQIIVNGGEENVPNIVSITIPGVLHEFIAIALAEHGICVSTGSSCSLRKDEEDKEAIRFSFGRNTSKKDVETAVRKLKQVLL